MPAIDYREMRRMYDLDGPERTIRNLREALSEGHLKPKDFSLKQMAEALVPDGVEWVRSMDPKHAVTLVETGDGVDVTAFANITGQIVFNRLIEDYQIETQVTDTLVETIPTDLSGEKIAGIDSLADNADEVPEGMPFPNFGFGEEFYETPPTRKRGYIVPVTKEAIFFDRTGKVLTRAGQLGTTLGLNKSKRVWDMILGLETTFAEGGKFKYNGNEIDVYNTTAVDITAASGPFYINEITDELADFTDINAAEQLFSKMVDPTTGEPLAIAGMRQIICVPTLMQTARNIINATEIRETTNTNTVTISSSPIAGEFAPPISSALMRQRLIAASVSESAADKRWAIGDFRRAFSYMENWPIRVLQAPPNSTKEFEQDIVVQFRADERGNVAVKDPHFVVRSVPT